MDKCIKNSIFLRFLENIKQINAVYKICLRKTIHNYKEEYYIDYEFKSNICLHTFRCYF